MGCANCANCACNTGSPTPTTNVPTSSASPVFTTSPGKSSNTAVQTFALRFSGPSLPQSQNKVAELVCDALQNLHPGVTLNCASMQTMTPSTKTMTPSTKTSSPSVKTSSPTTKTSVPSASPTTKTTSPTV